jgi:membrane protease YdiL (CAAX protease family)
VARNPASRQAESEAPLENQQFERINVYGGSPGPRWPSPVPTPFQLESGNTDFRPTVLTWVNLFLLLLVYPILSLAGGGDKTINILENITQPMLMFLLITTVLFQWMIFVVNFGGVVTEKTGLRGLGLTKIRGVDFAWGIAFLISANVILAGLAWALAQIGLPMPGEIEMLIPTETSGKILWVVVSFTAGFCEEIAFRGYLMTRIRLLFNLPNWAIPVLVSSLVFGACHAYQGWPGFIVITAYGVMFALLYIRTKSLWPCIIAHSLQDLNALTFPYLSETFGF